MMASFFWISTLLSISVSALPRETVSATATANRSPAPTRGMHELFDRGLYPVNLCGWQGPQFQGAYCGSQSSCAWFTDYSVIGCCSISGSCDAVYTSCIDGDHSPQSVSYPGVLTCPSGKNPLCYLNTFPSNYSQYGCGSTSVGEIVVTSFTGINTQLSIAIVYTGGVLDAETPVVLMSSTAAATSSSTSTVPPPSKTSSVVPNVPTTSGSAVYAPSSTSSLPIAPSNVPPTTLLSENQSKGLSVTAKIAIGVVAGLLATIAALTTFFCFSRRPKQYGTPTADRAIVSAPPPSGPHALESSENTPMAMSQNYHSQTMDTPAVPVVSPISTITSPTPTSSDVFEVPTKPYATPANSGLGIAELDGSGIGNVGMPSNHSGGNLKG